MSYEASLALWFALVAMILVRVLVRRAMAAADLERDVEACEASWSRRSASCAADPHTDPADLVEWH